MICKRKNTKQTTHIYQQGLLNEIIKGFAKKILG